jgi:hypothetical protein
MNKQITRFYSFDHPDPGRKNPCIPLHGEGPEGTTCETCQHLVVLRYSRRYYNCKLRHNTDGAASDHQRRWPSCGRFLPEPQEVNHA